jgi:hypothetical protein
MEPALRTDVFRSFGSAVAQRKAAAAFSRARRSRPGALENFYQARK